MWPTRRQSIQISVIIREVSNDHIPSATVDKAAFSICKQDRRYKPMRAKCSFRHAVRNQASVARSRTQIHRPARFRVYLSGMGSSIPAPLPAWLAIDERKAARLPLGVTVMADSNLSGELAVTIVDISTLGALLKTASKLTVGSFVTLKMNDTLTYGGWIAWTKGDFAGLDFANAMPEAVVRRLSATKFAGIESLPREI